MIVVAEKGSVARAIHRAINAPIKVLALSGHLLELDFPKEYNDWWRVDPAQLFEAPVDWIVRDEKAYRELVKALRSSGNPTLVLATDNDHEGELIAYEVLLVARRELGSIRFFRMRFNSATLSELRQAWERLEADLNWGWVWKAYFRHKFDLITGAIYTRALTLSARKAGRDVRLISWGSCQTPTLWFIMERERQIRSFKPETYYTLEALVKISNIVLKLSSRTIRSEAEAKALYERAKQAEAALVEAFTSQREVERRPLPAETDSMLQDLTKILGVSGAKIMAEAEQLYAEGYISYPRTQTNQWVDVDHHRILLMLASSQLAGYVKLENLNPRNGFKNDGAHPPIYPTKVYSYRDLKGRIWEYLARRYLANTVYNDAIYRRWKLVANLAGVRLEASGRHFVDEGFYKVYPYFKPRELQWVPELHSGDRLPVLEVKLVKRKTKPPPRLSESELLRLLEAHGIGTDATRHEFPAIVLSRGYAVKQGKTFKPTELGEQLLNLLSMVDRRLVTPETRRLVEETMARVERGELESEQALREVLKVYRELYLKLEETLKLNPPLGICQGGSSG